MFFKPSSSQTWQRVNFPKVWKLNINRIKKRNKVNFWRSGSQRWKSSMARDCGQIESGRSLEREYWRRRSEADFAIFEAKLQIVIIFILTFTVTSIINIISIITVWYLKVETFPPFLGCENIPVIPGTDPVGKAARSGFSFLLCLCFAVCIIFSRKMKKKEKKKKEKNFQAILSRFCLARRPLWWSVAGWARPSSCRSLYVRGPSSWASPASPT